MKTEEEHADKAHTNRWEFVMKVNEAAINNANVALRTALIINGGAAIAMLTFIGNLYSANPKISPYLGQLVAPLMWFAWGVALAALAVTFAYFTNYSVVEATARQEWILKDPYFLDTRGSKCWSFAKGVFHIVAIITGVASLAFFIFGMFEIRDAITMLNRMPTE